MAYTERTRLEEVLIRVGLDTNGKEKITGAHSQTITEGLVDGVVRFAAPSSVTPLALDDSGVGTLSAILGDVTATALGSNQVLRTSLASANEANAQLMADNERAMARIEELKAQLAQAKSDLSEFEQVIVNLRSGLESSGAGAEGVV